MTALQAKTVKILRSSCILLALWFSYFFLSIALRSMNYPFALEWMEGQSIDVVQRVLNWQGVYADPAIDYVAFIYTPFYYYVTAFVAMFTGVDFLAGRLVSFCATLGTVCIIAAWVRKEGGSKKNAFISVGLFLATYRASGRWFDIARVDSLCLFLGMAGLYMFFHYRERKHSVAAGILLALAFFTKQSALLMTAPILLSGLFYYRRHALVTASVMGACILAEILVSDALSDGWFSFFVFIVPAGHPLDSFIWLHFWTRPVLQVGFMMALSMLGIAIWLRNERRKALYYGLMLIGCVAASYCSLLHKLGYINVLMPMHAAVALIAGVTLSDIERNGNITMMIAASAMVMCQMIGLFYNPRPLVPNQASIDAGNRFLLQLAHIDGNIFMPDIQFVQTRIGKKSYAFGMAAYDLIRSDLGRHGYVKNDFADKINTAMKNEVFAAIVPGARIFNHLPGLFKYYQVKYSSRYPEGNSLDSVPLRRVDVFVPKPLIPTEGFEK